MLTIILNKNFCLFFRLKGRFDLLLNQIKRNTDDDPLVDHENVLVYEDDDDSNTLNSEDNVVMENGDGYSTAEDDEEEEDVMDES